MDVNKSITSMPTNFSFALDTLPFVFDLDFDFDVSCERSWSRSWDSTSTACLLPSFVDMTHPYWTSSGYTHTHPASATPSFLTTDSNTNPNTAPTSSTDMDVSRDTRPVADDTPAHQTQSQSAPQHRPPPLLIHPPPHPTTHDPSQTLYGFAGAAQTSYLPWATHTPQGYYYSSSQPSHFIQPPHSAALPSIPTSAFAPPSLMSMGSNASISSFASTSTSASPSPDIASPGEPMTAPLPNIPRGALSIRTNWEPQTRLDDLDTPISASTTSSSRLIHPPPMGEPPQMLSRSRRAAASRARSNITSIVTGLQSPPRSASSASSRPLAISSRPPSARPSASGMSSAASPAMSNLSLKSKRGRTASASASAAVTVKPLRVQIHVHPKKPPVMLELKNHRGALLDAPQGAQLEVNDLLILHPPTLSPDAKIKPVNQYNQPPGVIGEGVPIEGYRSMYEMYTCRVCSKTYDGRNARSVARRHLQDKHGVKLMFQQRRTRWDLEPERPKTAIEAREKTLKSKRNWATRVRMIAKLEKTHTKFLARYGPDGIVTPCKTRLVAPNMRGNTSKAVTSKTYPDGHLGWDRIPKALREGLSKFSAVDVPPVGMSDEDAEGEWEEEDDEMGEQEGTEGLPQALRLSLPSAQAASYSNHNQDGGHDSKPDVADSRESSAEEFASASFAQSRPAMSHSRSAPIITGHTGQACNEDDGGWSIAWGSATHVDEKTLETVMAQHQADYHVIPPDFTVPKRIADDTHKDGSSEDDESSESPDALGPIRAPHHPAWSGQVDTSQVNPMWFPRLQTYDYSSSSSAHPSSEKRWPHDTSPIAIPTATPAKSLGGDVVAAESLLNLHSTPARPEDDTADLPSSLTAASCPSSHPHIQSSTASSVIRGLLDAPEITPRSRPTRARSIIQPFNKSRPEAMTRSISFSQQMLDDPFAISPNTTKLLKAADASLNTEASLNGGKRRRSIVATPSATPSPLTKRKKDERQWGLRDGSPRQALGVLRPNMNAANVSSSAFSMTRSTSAVLGFGTYASGGEPIMTPVRARAGAGVPSSLSKVWQFSSPGDPGGAAADLGLLPSWGAMFGGGTPGMSGMVNSETPARGR